MMQSISWSQYLTGLVIILILYYVFVWIVYFKGRFPFNEKQHSNPEVSAPDNLPASFSSVTEQLQIVFEQNYNRQELIMALQKTLRSYMQCDERVKETINHIIVQESISKCSIHLGEEDLRVLWVR